MSWWVSRSYSAMRSRSNEARRILSMASRGTTPWSAQASQTAISTSNHFRVLFWGDQMRPISGRVYRSII